MHPKKAFGGLLHEYARSNNKTFAEVAKKAGISPSYVAKWKGGRWDTIPDDLLTRVIAACTSDPGEQADLIGAYLIDITPPDFKARIRIERVAGKEETEPLAGPWNSPLRRQLEAIAKAAKRNDEFARMFETLAGWADRINAPTSGNRPSSSR